METENAAAPAVGEQTDTGTVALSSVLREP